MNACPHPESRFKRILFCTDFSESADAAFEFALDATVRRPGSTLNLLHVIHEPDAQFWKSYIAEVDNVDADAKKAIDEKVATAYRSRLPAGVEMKAEFRIGPDARNPVPENEGRSPFPASPSPANCSMINCGATPYRKSAWQGLGDAWPGREPVHLFCP